VCPGGPLPREDLFCPTGGVRVAAPPEPGEAERGRRPVLAEPEPRREGLTRDLGDRDASSPSFSPHRIGELFGQADRYARHTFILLSGWRRGRHASAHQGLEGSVGALHFVSCNGGASAPYPAVVDLTRCSRPDGSGGSGARGAGGRWDGCATPADRSRGCSHGSARSTGHLRRPPRRPAKRDEMPVDRERADVGHGVVRRPLGRGVQRLR